MMATTTTVLRVRERERVEQPTTVLDAFRWFVVGYPGTLSQSLQAFDVFLCPACTNWSVQDDTNDGLVFDAAFDAVERHRAESPGCDLMIGLLLSAGGV